MARFGIGLASRAWIQQHQDGITVVSIAADASLRMARHKRRAHFVELVHRRGDERISSWSDFYAAMAERKLLARLDEFHDALLIAGCDWSATTAITRLFNRLSCFADSSWQHDDELDGALLLANGTDDAVPGRHCFQTTYLRERHREYFEHERFKLVWIIREPRSAVRSLLASRDRTLPPRTALGLAGKSAGGQGTSRLEKACAAYLATIRQTWELKERLGERVAIVDFDELTAHRNRLLPALCRFAAVECDARVLHHLHGKSVRKGALAPWEALIVDQLASAAYRRARLAATLRIAPASDGAAQPPAAESRRTLFR